MHIALLQPPKFFLTKGLCNSFFKASAFSKVRFTRTNRSLRLIAENSLEGWRLTNPNKKNGWRVEVMNESESEQGFGQQEHIARHQVWTNGRE